MPPGSPPGGGNWKFGGSGGMPAGGGNGKPPAAPGTGGGNGIPPGMFARLGMLGMLGSVMPAGNGGRPLPGGGKGRGAPRPLGAVNEGVSQRDILLEC
jgi:hypothetical protein